MTHLRNFPANTIKIDQSFVKDMLDDPNDYAIISAVIGLANSFSRNIIAEGVETPELGLMLLLMGCNDAQGYGIARPMPASELPNWLAHYQPNEDWIACGSKTRSDKDSKVSLFRLIINQWLVRITTIIQSPDNQAVNWPIMNPANCHCGAWLQRARQEKLFEEKWLVKLGQRHETLHTIGNSLFNKYQNNDIAAATAGLADLNKAFESLSNVLGQSE